MMRNLLRRNLMLGATKAARKSKSIRLNKLMIMKKMRLSPHNLPIAPLWLLPLS